jgi:hypothetical protein
MSAFYVAAYGSLSVPAILAGVVVSTISLQATFEIFGTVVAAIGLAVAFEAWHTRPTRPATISGASTAVAHPQLSRGLDTQAPEHRPHQVHHQDAA